MPNAIAGMSAVKAGTDDCRAIGFGDSVIWGICADPAIGADNKVADHSNSMWAQASALLVADSVPSTAENLMGLGGLGFTIADTALGEAAFTYGTGWEGFNQQTAGGYGFRNVTNNTGTWSYQLVAQYTHATAYIIDQSNGDQLRWSVDAGAYTNFTATSGSPLALRPVTLNLNSGAAGAYKFNVQTVSGSGKFQGVIFYNTGARRVIMINAGSSSSASADWMGSTFSWSPFNSFTQLGVKVAFLELGAYNDSGNVPLATTLANFQSWITKCKANNIDPVIMVPSPLNSVNSEPMRQGLRTLATTNSCALIDIMDIYADWTAWTAVPTKAYDAIHPNVRGHAAFAALIKYVMKLLYTLAP